MTKRRKQLTRDDIGPFAWRIMELHGLGYTWAESERCARIEIGPFRPPIITRRAS